MSEVGPPVSLKARRNNPIAGLCDVAVRQMLQGHFAVIEQDIFVGIVATGLGFFVIGSAILNTEGFSRFWFCRRVENSFGPQVARGVGGMIGLAMATLGILLMLGFLPAKKSRSGRLPDHPAAATGYRPALGMLRHA